MTSYNYRVMIIKDLTMRAFVVTIFVVGSSFMTGCLSTGAMKCSNTNTEISEKAALLSQNCVRIPKTYWIGESDSSRWDSFVESFPDKNFKIGNRITDRFVPYEDQYFSLTLNELKDEVLRLRLRLKMLNAEQKEMSEIRSKKIIGESFPLFSKLDDAALIQWLDFEAKYVGVMRQQMEAKDRLGMALMVYVMRKSKGVDLD